MKKVRFSYYCMKIFALKINLLKTRFFLFAIKSFFFYFRVSLKSIKVRMKLNFDPASMSFKNRYFLQFN